MRFKFVPSLIDGRVACPLARAVAQESGLEEIVVTATRREESLQNVANSATVFSAQDLQALRVLEPQGPRRADAGAAREVRAERPRDRRVLPARGRHQRFHRHGRPLGRHLRRRSVPADARHAQLRRLRHRARRGAARPAGHALRAQQHRRRDQLPDRPADRGVRRVRARGVRQLPHVHGTGAISGPIGEHAAAAACRSTSSTPRQRSATRTTASPTTISARSTR